MVSKKLTTHLKKQYKPIIEDRDGKACFYCGELFQSKLSSLISGNDNPQEFDHLNNNEEDNFVENLVLAHRLCNRRKSSVNEWIVKAKNKLRDNLRSAKIPESHANSDKPTGTETDTNAYYNSLVPDQLGYWLRADRNGQKGEPRKYSLPQKEFVDLLTAKSIQGIGHGSQTAIQRILDAFCTIQFGYIKEKDEKKKWNIRLRTDDDKDFFKEDD